jgi:hypothetical protein
MTESITTWNRLEPRSTALVPGPGTALEARVYDPAWLLGRQWQLGELTGEDAASPGFVRVRVAVTPLTRYRPGTGGGTGVPIAADELLEPLAEAEPEADDWRSRSEAGAHFLELLIAAGLRQLQQPFRDAYRLPDPDRLGPEIDRDTRGFLRLMRRRSLDGLSLREAVRAAAESAGQPVALPAAPAVDADLTDRLLDVLGRWLAWHPAPRVQPSWVAERMEYRFAVAGRAPSGRGELALEASEYEGGRLDWPDFQVLPLRPLGAARDPAPTRSVQTVIPTPVTYPGMPAGRWWEFEDGRIWFGGIETEAGDLARMLLVEFATIYGNDWFITPVELAAGTLAQVESLVVVDTFGQKTLIHPTEVFHGVAGRPWRMFRNTGAPPDVLFVPPVLAHSLQGADAEEVVFVRDETANMAWAIERRIIDPAGNTVDRYERWRARIAALASAEEPQDRMNYEVMTEVPDHWIPLVPKSVGLRAIRLDRGTMVDPSGATFPPLGRLLEPERPLSLFEEELPRAGLAVTRAWQVARGPDGNSVAWIGRRKRPGRGEGSSGLAFDELFPAEGDKEATRRS